MGTPAPLRTAPGGADVEVRLFADRREAQVRTQDMAPPQPFADACAAVVGYLKQAVPLGYWSVSRADGDRQLYLSVRDDAYGCVAGDSHRWSDSLCTVMARGAAPRIAPDAMAVPAYAAAPISRVLKIGAYVDMPIAGPDGDLFGTICGLDPSAQDEALREQGPLLELLATLLRTVLAADLASTDAARATEAMQNAAETDALTTLHNRRGWDRFLADEDHRYRRFGDPATVVVLDLDGLKAVNDTQGHTAGDALLRLAASTLRETTRTSDMVARLGGDEFGLVAAATPAEADGLVSRLHAALAAKGISASIGAAPYTIQGGFGRACELADQAMYAQKLRARAAAAASRSGQASRRSSV